MVETVQSTEGKTKVRNVSNGKLDLNLPQREVIILPFKEEFLDAQEIETDIVQTHIKNKDLVVRY